MDNMNAANPPVQKSFVTDILVQVLGIYSYIQARVRTYYYMDIYVTA
jgi:hypothetical protein